jgi:trigger factor
MSTVQLSNVSVDKGEGGLVTLNIEVAPETVRAARQRALKAWSKRLRVPGFRPGHIPPNIVLRQVGEESLAQSVSDDLVPKVYQEALQQAELVPLERATVDELPFDAFEGDKPLTLRAHVIVRPEIDLGNLEGLELSRPAIEISDEDVNTGLESLRNERAQLKDIEGRGAQNGDVLSAELQVYINGEPRSDEPAPLRAFILGESGFTPNIDEHLLDAKLDEERRFTLTYPDDFQDEELAGKEAEFAVKITALKERLLPELNDEFAQAAGAENIDGLREQMKQFLQARKEREANEAMRTELVQKVVEGATLEVPGELVGRRAHNRFHAFEHELQHRESTLDDYLTETNQSREEFEASLAEEIAGELKQELVLDEIAQKQNVEVTIEEIENHYRMMSQVLRQPIEQLLNEVDVETVRASIRQRKAIDWLMQNAKINEENN